MVIYPANVSTNKLRNVYHGTNNVKVTYFFNSSGTSFLYKPTTHAPPNPKLCCKATFAPGTCLLPHSPLNCRHSSKHCAKPKTQMYL